MAKKLKDFIQTGDKRVEPKPKFGTNPFDPWSPKAGLHEADTSVQTYLKSKGLDPRYVTRNQLIAHSRSGDYSSWKKERSEVSLRNEEKHSPTEHSATELRRQHLQKIIHVHKEVGTAKDSIKEDKFQDSMAATQTVGMEIESKHKRHQLSKSARILKSIYKKLGMKNEEVIHEDLYDHEKEDKSVKTYGRKPKFNQTDEKDSMGENKPTARAMLTGGTTLTGEKRETVEFDPVMRNRPGQPDATKKETKDKKSNK